MSTENKEKRSFRAEIRATEDSRHVDGYAALIGSESEDLGGFIEVIEPGAFDGVIEVSDVLCPLDHNTFRGVLARSRNGKGSLTLTADDKGLRYSFDAPATALGDELLEGIRRGDISGSSFCFTIEAEEWLEYPGRPDFWLRKIKKIKQLYDVSPVYNPAYSDTTVALRSLGEARETVTPKKQLTFNELTL